MQNKPLALYLVFLTAACGCSSTPSSQLIADYSVLPHPLAAVTAPVEGGGEVSEISEPEVLSLANALALTLNNSPELRSFSYDLRVGEARLLQAGLLPNPELSLTVEDVLGTGDYSGGTQAQSTLQLSQLIELGGKRKARVGLATLSRQHVSEQYEIKRVEVLTGLTDKFIRTSADQELLKLADRGEKLARQSLENIQRRVHAGGASELEESRAKVLLARAHIAAEHAEHELRSSKQELAAHWGRDRPSFTSLLGELFKETRLPPEHDILSQIDSSLEIKRWATEARLREAEEKLAQAKSVPNLLLGAGPRRLEAANSESWVFQLSMPLTLFDRNQGAREEAGINRARTENDTEMARLRLKTVLFGLYQEALHEQTVLEMMRTDIIPQAEKSLKIAESGYEQGRFSYLELLDAQRALLEVYRENIESAYSFHSFINSIERLLGAPLQSSPGK